MSLKSKRILILPVVLAISFFSFAFAQTSTSQEAKTISKVEISIPLQKEDFLLFYGITNDEETNSKIIELRKDFSEKFENLKEEYKKSFYDIAKDSALKPNIAEEKKEDNKTKEEAQISKTSINTKSVADSKSIKEIASSTNTSVKKYIIEDTKNNIINPIINIISEKSSIKTESSSWFQKIKSWFGW